MGKFLDTSELPKLNPEDIKKKNLNRPITSNEIESAIKKKKFPNNNKTQDQDGFTTEIYQTFKEEYQFSSNYSKELRGSLYPDTKTS
jgi:hypothetical protein